VVSITVAEFGTRFGSWYVLLNGYQPTGFRSVIQTDLVIKFINHIIPSKASGHAIAPLVVRHFTGTEWQAAVAIAGLNTGLYALLYGIVSFAGIALLFTSLSTPLVIVLTAAAGIYLTVGILGVAAGQRMTAVGRLFQHLRSSISRIPLVGTRAVELLDREGSFTAEAQSIFRSLSSSPRLIVGYTTCWLGTIFVFPGIRVLVLLDGFGMSVATPWVIPLALVMAYSVTILPITPGGLGISELSASLVLVALGIPESAAVTAILIDRSLGVYLPALLGWVPAIRVDLAAIAEGVE
jgi:uncharacterized protein (TIRG00374 family)